MVNYDARNWVAVLTQAHGSVMPKLALRVLSIALLGALASVLFETRAVKFPAVAHTMVGAALGLLLVFRTNASYDRYWEGRKLLGASVNRIRDLMRQAAGHTAGEAGRAFTTELQRKLVIFFGLQRQYLRQERSLEGLSAALNEAEQKELEPLAVRPVVYLSGLTRMVAQARENGLINAEVQQSMDGNLTALLDYLGGAERIMKTPVPFAYAQHIKGFLFIFCCTLPFVLAEPTGRWNAVASAAVAYALFGIEEIGVEIEDPFGDDPNDLPIDAMEQGIARVTADQVASLPLTTCSGKDAAVQVAAGA